MNVTDVANRVKRLFGDEGGVQITDTDIIRWINDGQLQIAINNDDILETTGTANIVTNQADYSAPTNMRSLRSLMYKGFRLRYMSFSEFNEYVDGFRATNSIYGTGVPDTFMVWNDTITLFPTPNENITSGLTIYYNAKPTTVSTLADPLSIPEEFHLAVVDYCLSQAYELDENMTGASYKKNEFDEQVQRLSLENREKTTEYYPRITTMPEDEGFWSGWGGWY